VLVADPDATPTEAAPPQAPPAAPSPPPTNSAAPPAVPPPSPTGEFTHTYQASPNQPRSSIALLVMGGLATLGILAVAGLYGYQLFTREPAAPPPAREVAGSNPQVMPHEPPSATPAPTPSPTPALTPA